MDGLATHRSDRALQLKIKVPTGADLYAVFIVAAAVIVIWGGIFYMLVKAIS